jgi:hypothetical protein
MLCDKFARGTGEGELLDLANTKKGEQLSFLSFYPVYIIIGQTCVIA